MKNWRCSNAGAQEELEKLVHAGQHIGHVLPAYIPRADGDHLIPPNLYKAKLRGALVTVKAAITFQNLSGRNMNEDSYYADIREIRVIRSRPSPSPRSPSGAKLKENLAKAIRGPR